MQVNSFNSFNSFIDPYVFNSTPPRVEDSPEAFGDEDSLDLNLTFYTPHYRDLGGLTRDNEDDWQDWLSNCGSDDLGNCVFQDQSTSSYQEQVIDDNALPPLEVPPYPTSSPSSLLLPYPPTDSFLIVRDRVRDSLASKRRLIRASDQLNSQPYNSSSIEKIQALLESKRMAIRAFSDSHQPYRSLFLPEEE